MSRAATEYRYEKLTWPEINDAVELQKVCLVPCGAIEQHGPHLPLDVDVVCPQGIALGAGRLAAENLLVLPTICYGYTGHVMDFPGTINCHYQHFIDHVLDVCKSLAYHGFKKIVLFNGHGSNMPLLDIAARRATLETDAECVALAWWGLLTIDKEFLPGWRESEFPGGFSHACELETSMMMALRPELVCLEEIEDDPDMTPAAVKSIFWTRDFGRRTDHGAVGYPSFATAQKGQKMLEAAIGAVTRVSRGILELPLG